jgi:hypothetical protein
MAGAERGVAVPGASIWSEDTAAPGREGNARTPAGIVAPRLQPRR